MTDQEKIEAALDLAISYGSIDGGHHKMWLIDQIVRVLAKDYEFWVTVHNDGEDGPDTYAWDIGIAP